MAYGINDNGFTAKRLQTLLSEILSNLKSKYPELNLQTETIAYQIAALTADQQTDLWELLEDVYNGTDPDVASGYQQDKLFSLCGLIRRPAKAATTLLTFSSAAPGVLIPEGTQVYLEGDNSIIFETVADTTTAVAANDDEQYLIFGTTATKGTYKLEFDGKETSLLNYNASIATVEAALEALSTIGSGNIAVTNPVSNTYLLTFDGTLASLPQNLITVSETSVADANGFISLTTEKKTTGGSAIKTTAVCTTTGARDIDFNQVNTLVGTISGLLYSQNDTKITGGSDLETDAEFRLRKNIATFAANANSEAAIKTNLFRLNNSEARDDLQILSVITDVDRTVNHDVTTIIDIAAGYTTPDYKKEQIAQAIYDGLPVGIATDGTVTKTIDDTNGNSISIKYSYATQVTMYAEIAITVDADIFPDNGEEQIQNALVTWGNAKPLGALIVLNGSDSVNTILNSVEGILAVTGITVDDVTPTVATTNYQLADTERGVWEAANITITVT